jgi:hypothetical protein
MQQCFDECPPVGACRIKHQWLLLNAPLARCSPFGLGAGKASPSALRGPDEIAHFLRIHSYARGELLPSAEVDGRKGIFVKSKRTLLLWGRLLSDRPAGVDPTASAWPQS